MAFRIASNVVPISAARNLNIAQQQLDKSLTRLASGSRVVRAGDDAAGYAIAESLRGQIGGVRQAKSNAESATDLIQTAEGGLSEQNNILVRLRELAVYSASDTVGDKEREFLNSEFQQLTQEFDRIAKATRFGDKQLLTGTGDQFQFQVGPYSDADNMIKFKMDADTTASHVGVSGLDVSDQDSALSALSDIDSAITEVAGARANFGAMQSRLQHAANALGVQDENLESARSHIEDVDVASESAKLAQAQLQQQASIAVLAQANQAGSRAIRLLE